MDKFFEENAIIATRIVFLIINVPLMAIMLSWKVNCLVCGIELALFIALYLYENTRKVKFMKESSTDIHIIIKGYAIAGMVSSGMYVIDIVCEGFLGMAGFELNVYCCIISIIISILTSIFLLCKNEWILKWICNNYKRDPIMLEAHKNTKDKQNIHE